VKQLLSKLESIKGGSNSHEFILADARDADMAWGITSFGKKRSLHSPDGTDRYRTNPEFLDEIRSVVEQGIIVLPPLIHVDSGGRVLHCCEGLVLETK
jgi:hypothetical protein